MDNMSLEFCEHFPDEFPMMDTFKIIGDLMQQIVERRIDMRTIFRRHDARRERFLSQQQYVAVLDSLALTQVMLCVVLSLAVHDYCVENVPARSLGHRGDEMK
jgi:hypothetical protein